MNKEICNIQVQLQGNSCRPQHAICVVLTQTVAACSADNADVTQVPEKTSDACMSFSLAAPYDVKCWPNLRQWVVQPWSSCDVKQGYVAYMLSPLGHSRASSCWECIHKLCKPALHEVYAHVCYLCTGVTDEQELAVQQNSSDGIKPHYIMDSIGDLAAVAQQAMQQQQ